MLYIIRIWLTISLLQTAHTQKGDTCEGGDECQNGDTGAARYQAPPCPEQPPGLGQLAVDEERHPLDVIERGHSSLNITPGGHWRPRACRARQSVAVLVPYRDRLEDLKLFINTIHRFLQAQLLEYSIYLIEQGDDKHFNRAALLNIGYELAMKHKPYDCIVLHDIDKYPEDTRNHYGCTGRATHLNPQMRYHRQEYRKMPYDDYFGGVTSLSTKNFKKINGFSNIFWGWGSEDDDLLNRIKHHGIATDRRSAEVGRYVETWHPYGFVNPRRHEVNKDGRNRWDTDGLNSLDYKLVKTVKRKLYTIHTVKLLHEDPYYDKK